MVGEFVHGPEPIIIQGFKASFLPWMEFASLKVIVLCPVLYFVLKRGFEQIRNQGTSTSPERGLFAITAILVFLSAFTPVMEYYTHWSNFREGSYISDKIRWLPVTAASSLLWSLALSSMIAVGAFRHLYTASLTASAVGVYYVTFPLAYSVLHGRIPIGPSIREIAVIALAALLMKIGMEKENPANFRGRVACLILVMTCSIAAALQLHRELALTSEKLGGSF